MDTAGKEHHRLQQNTISKYCFQCNFFPVILYYTMPAGIYLLKVNNKNTRIKVWNKFKVNNKDTKTTPMNISHTFVLVFLLLTLNM